MNFVWGFIVPRSCLTFTLMVNVILILTKFLILSKFNCYFYFDDKFRLKILGNFLSLTISQFNCY